MNKSKAAGGGQPQTTSGAEQATIDHKRGRRGNGRRLRRAVKDAERRRGEAIADLMPFDPWRRFVLARIDAEIGQYRWEMRTGWTGDPGQGPRLPQTMPLPARPGIPPREIRLVTSLLRPWKTYVPKTPVRDETGAVIA